MFDKYGRNEVQILKIKVETQQYITHAICDFLGAVLEEVDSKEFKKLIHEIRVLEEEKRHRIQNVDRDPQA